MGKGAKSFLKINPISFTPIDTLFFTLYNQYPWWNRIYPMQKVLYRLISPLWSESENFYFPGSSQPIGRLLPFSKFQMIDAIYNFFSNTLLDISWWIRTRITFAFHFFSGLSYKFIFFETSFISCHLMNFSLSSIKSCLIFPWNSCCIYK